MTKFALLSLLIMATTAQAGCQVKVQVDLVDTTVEYSRQVLQEVVLDESHPTVTITDETLSTTVEITHISENENQAVFNVMIYQDGRQIPVVLQSSWETSATVRLGEHRGAHNKYIYVSITPSHY